MITKAIVEQIIDSNHIKIRIPIYDKVAAISDSTPTEQLSIAGVSTPAGMRSLFTVGDVVLIGFEEDQLNKPIILGLLQTADEMKSSSDIQTDSLVVKVNYSLPVSGDSIKQGGSTTGVSSLASGSVDQALLMIQQRLDKLELQLSYNVGDIFATTVDATPTDMGYSGTWTAAANSFVLKFDDSTVPVFLWRKDAD